MKSTFLLLTPFLLAALVSSYNLEGIFPASGPATGATRVSIYSPTFKGMNYTDHPTPKCKFSNGDIQQASWIHCIGSATHPSATKDQTCLNCETPGGDAGRSKVQVSIKGDFTDTADITFLYYAEPTLTWIVPQMGWKSGGTTVEVHGDNFQDLPGLGCAFGAVNVPATFVSQNVITCKSPPSEIAGSPIPIRVTQNDQQYTDARIHYFYAATAEISKLVPNEGAIAGGTEVWLLGRQMYPFESKDVLFSNTTFARFGPDKYMPLELVNQTHAKTTSPPSNTPSSVPVEITFNNQEWTANGILFHYYIAPYVVSLTPDLGIIEGGTNVTVLGANIQNTTTLRCKFGQNSVPAYYINDNSAWCITPPSDTVGLKDFGISNENERYSSSSIKFLYVKKPVISSISPSCGPTTGFTQIAVTGENFVYTGINKVACIFGNDIYQPATVINETLLYCDSPKVLDRFGNNINDTDNLHFRLTLNSYEISESDFNFVYYTLNNITTINPKIGPLEGGTQVTVTGTDFSRSCKITCRFATMEVPGEIVTLSNNTQITCASPAASCSGDSVVQVSLNGQQYTQNPYELEYTSFTHYQMPVVAYAVPTSFPTSGVSSIGVYGKGFLISKNGSTLDNGDVRVSYQCRYKDSTTGAIINVTSSSYFTDSYIYCKTPLINDVTSTVAMEISPNGQSWLPVPGATLSFYNAPVITSIEPTFGRVKENGTLVVNGKYFECPDNNCDVRCSFSNPNVKVVTTGTLESSERITCPIPALSRPEMTKVQVTLNGADFTPQDIYYTFYDAFVVNMEPAYVPVEGNVPVKIIGLGFADTSALKVRLQDPTDDSILLCGGSPCILTGTYTSPNELSFVIPPQGAVQTAAGNPIGFSPINVEVSVYGDVFTDNNVQLNYFQQPTVGGPSLTVAQASYEFHANAMGTIFVPIAIQIPEGITEEDFLRRTRILCKYTLESQSAITEGKLVQYPYPAAANVSAENASVECTLPPLNPGTGTVGVALNGVNFVGNLPITVIPQLTIDAINPKCGPREGGTVVGLKVGGVQSSDYNNNIFFSWSSICTDPLTTALFTDPSVVTTVTPPAQNGEGGFSLVSFSAYEKVSFADDTNSQQRIQNHFESISEFLYYRRPIITRVYPHAGISTGGTPITVEGAYFFDNKAFGCSPKCKFGNTTVPARYLSTVRISCQAPPGLLGSFVPLTITMNGQDEADSQTPQTFGYIGLANIQSISPVSGPATGGTMLALFGQDFVDMSQYPDEFTCIFRPVNSDQPSKITPASFINSTAIVCSTPGGWNAGTTTTVDISFNGVDYSSSGLQYKFYQIDKIAPLSGPAAGGSVITITGSGLKPDIMKGNAGCKIDNVISNATVSSGERIQCPVPAATGGADFHGKVDLYYTLDGVKWEQVLQGFNYYQQPTIKEVVPKFISETGGKIKIIGNNLRPNFFGATPTCRIDDTEVPMTAVSNTEVNCNFSSVSFNNEANHYIQIALNGASYTPKTDAAKLDVFKVSSVRPPAGVIQGGTQLLIEGQGFPEGPTPYCKFGVEGMTTSSVGTRINDRQISCPTPSSPFAQIDGEIAKVPFTVHFGDHEFDKWNHAGLFYHYYSQPEVIDISPKRVSVEDNLLVTITSSIQNPFNESIIGTNPSKIVCKFGDLGTTPGALMAFNKIGCATPNARKLAENVGETVKVQISLNGQDFIEIPHDFMFVGIGANETPLYVYLAFGAIILALMLYITRKGLTLYVGNEKTKLVDEVSRVDTSSQDITDIANDDKIVV